MEARKIVVIQTKTQRKSVIMSEATTLRELKTDLRANGIDYNDMTFFEGTSKTELKTDDSVLPHDVPYKGQITNELVFMLTNTNKKIRSGSMSRAEAYNSIKSMGLQRECVKRFGKNYTQCKTDDLILLIESYSKPKDTKPVVESPKEEPTPKIDTPVNKESEGVDKDVRAAIYKLVNVLEDNEIITSDEREEILNILGGVVNGTDTSEDYKPKSSSPYSDDEIEDMFCEMDIR